VLDDFREASGVPRPPCRDGDGVPRPPLVGSWGGMAGMIAATQGAGRLGSGHGRSCHPRTESRHLSTTPARDGWIAVWAVGGWSTDPCPTLVFQPPNSAQVFGALVQLDGLLANPFQTLPERLLFGRDGSSTHH
jgi:hypothetical protein